MSFLSLLSLLLGLYDVLDTQAENSQRVVGFVDLISEGRRPWAVGMKKRALITRWWSLSMAVLIIPQFVPGQNTKVEYADVEMDAARTSLNVNGHG